MGVTASAGLAVLVNWSPEIYNGVQISLYQR